MVNPMPTNGPVGELALRDIHLPEPISWWPPAPGWWLLLLLLVVFATILLWMRKRQSRFRFRRLASAELKRVAGEYRRSNDHAALVANLSRWLRRTALCHYPRSACAGLTGIKWLEFLDRGLPESPFTAGVGRILAEGPYGPKFDDRECSAEELIALCEKWLETLPAVETKEGPR